MKEILEIEADVNCGMCGLSHDHMCCDGCGAQEQIDPNHGTVNYFDSIGKKHSTWDQACGCCNTVDGFPKVEVTGECSECGSLQKIRHNHDIPHEYSEGVCGLYFCEEFWEHQTGDECEVCECGLDNPNEHQWHAERLIDSWHCYKCNSSQAINGKFIDAHANGHDTSKEACIASNCDLYEEELEPMACRICNRELKGERARYLGIGPICEKKFQMKTLAVYSELSEDDLSRLLSEYDFVWTSDDIYFTTDRPPYFSSYKNIEQQYFQQASSYEMNYLLEKIGVKHWINEQGRKYRDIVFHIPKIDENYRSKNLEMGCTGSFELGNLKIDRGRMEQVNEEISEEWEEQVLEGVIHYPDFMYVEIANQLGIRDHGITANYRLYRTVLDGLSNGIDDWIEEQKNDPDPNDFCQYGFITDEIFGIGCFEFNINLSYNTKEMDGIINPHYAFNALMDENNQYLENDLYESIKKAIERDESLNIHFKQVDSYDIDGYYRKEHLGLAKKPDVDALIGMLNLTK